MSDTGQCSFCLHQVDSKNAIICGEDKKIYQDIYKCSQKYLQGETFCQNSFDWNNSDGLFSPFCAQCFKSAHKIHRTSQDLEKLQAVLNRLVEIFRDEVTLRISEISKAIVFQTSVPEINGNVIVTSPDEIYCNDGDDLQLPCKVVDLHPDDFDDASSLQFQSAEEVEQKEVVVKEETLTDEFNDNGIHQSSLRNTDDERHFEFGDDQEGEYILSTDEPQADLWPKVILERLQFDNNGHLIPPTFAKVNKRSVRKRTAAITARTSLKNSKKYFGSTDLSTHYVPPIERFKSRRTFLADNDTRNERRYPCNLCRKEFKSQTSLNSHKNIDHRQNGKVPQGLKFHVTKYKKKNQYSCELCGKSFPTCAQLTIHSRQIHDNVKCKCEICGKVLKNEFYRRSHVYMVHRSKEKTCKDCGLRFKTNTQLKRHVDTIHKKILKHHCETCGKWFAHFPNLRRHEEMHENDSERLKFKCEICGDKYFTQNVRLIDHQKQIHTVFTNGPITCHQCHNKFPDSSTLFIHTRKEAKDRLYRCEFCEERFSNRCKLYIHSAEAHPSEDQPYQCKHCFLFFNSETAIRQHSSEQHGITMLIFKCTLCGKVLSSETKLALHEENVHPGAKGINKGNVMTTGTYGNGKCKCDICGKTVSTKSLKRHRRLHLGGPTDTILCNLCGFAYSKRMFPMHESRCQEGRPHKKTEPALQTILESLESEKACKMVAVDVEGKDVARTKHIYKCNFCDKSYRCPALVKTHARVHTGEKPFVCEICGWAAITKNTLYVHKMRHTGEKPFMCDVCGMAFSQSGNLKRHKRTHTGERHHKCPHCEKSFSTKVILQTHIRIHTGEKPYSCKICSKAFSDRSTWYKHERNHK